MSWFGAWFSDAGSSGAGGLSFPNIANLTTEEAIRDRALDVIEALDPTILEGDRFRRFLDEGDGVFETWAEASAAGCQRRFQVVYALEQAPPAISNYDYHELELVLTVTVAYAQTARAGVNATRDRIDMMKADQHLIETAIGLLGRANFSPPWPDAMWSERGTRPSRRVVGRGVDFLVITQGYRFQRQMS